MRKLLLSAFCLFSSFNLLYGEIVDTVKADDPFIYAGSRQKGRPDKNCHHSSKYDYVIVGNGTAGAVLARKLSDNHKNNVLCLEIGRNRTDDPLVVFSDPLSDPIALNELTFSPKYAVCYPFTVSTPGQALPYSEGRMWGGCSAHNYLQAVRGTPPIYNAWAAISKNNRWKYNNLLPLMKDIETYTPNDTPFDHQQRGDHGPIFITQRPPVFTDPLAKGFVTGTDTPFVFDYNNINEGSVGISANQEFITPTLVPKRSYSQPAYLQVGEIIDADGNGLHGRQLKIVSGAFVSRVIFKGKKAIGVEYIVNAEGHEEKVVQVFASKKIILSAGSINSPAILQRSGIGDPLILEPLGVPVLVNNPNVGQHLINQFGPIGILSGVSASNAVGFIDGHPFFPKDGQRRIQLGSVNIGSGLVEVFGFNLEPHSRGSVEIVDTNPFVQPKLDQNLYTDQDGYDAQIALAFYKLLKNIAASIPGCEVIFPPPQDYLSDDALLADAKNIATSIVESHNVGTCRMSHSSKDGVVDGNLHVFGVKDLMVVDVGVEPVITDGNTCFGAYVIGNEAARIILEEEHKSSSSSSHHSCRKRKA